MSDDTQDIYELIRRLNFAPTTTQIQRDQEWGGGGVDDVTTWDLSGETGWDDLKQAGFQSKYNFVEDLGDGRLGVIFQNPEEGKNHKYDTLYATYAVDPATGEYVMQGDPQERRETSGLHSFQDFAEKAGLMVGAVMGAGYLGAGAAGAGAGTGAGAGAAAAGTGAAAAGASATTLGLTSAQWAAIQSAVINGAMTSGAASALGQLKANGWDLDEVDGKMVIKDAATGAVVAGVGAGIGAYNPGEAMGLEGAAAKAMNSALASSSTAAIQGGSGEDIWRSALAGGVAGSGQLNLTDNPAINRALTEGVRGYIETGDMSEAWERAKLSGLTSASDFAAEQTGVPPKLMRAVVPLANGDPVKAARLIARYGYDTYKPEVVGYLKELVGLDINADATPIDPLAPIEFPEIYEMSVALDNGTYDATHDLEMAGLDRPYDATHELEMAGLDPGDYYGGRSDTAIPDGQTVEITGQRIPPDPYAQTVEITGEKVKDGEKVNTDPIVKVVRDSNDEPADEGSYDFSFDFLPTAAAAAPAPVAQKGAEMFYFGALEPGGTSAADVTDFQGRRARGRYKQRDVLEDLEEADEADAPTRIAELMRLINGG